MAEKTIMRGWLRRLLGARSENRNTRLLSALRDGHLVGEEGVDVEFQFPPIVAAPGDLVILHYLRPMTLARRNELGEFLEIIHKHHPGVRFVLLDSAFAPVVVAKGAGQ